jgi:hypothetical protein
MKKVPVTRNGIEIGYTLDGGKTIQFYETPDAKKVIDELNSGQMIGISSRGIGTIDENNKVKERDVKELSFVERPKQGLLDMLGVSASEYYGVKNNEYKPVFNEAIESTKGAWQLFKESGSDIHQLQYWLPDGDRPQVVLNLNQEEFEDLETLFINIKKYRNE